MSKELEAFYCILNNDYTDDEMYKRAVNNVETALTELEQIKNAKPSEALECLEGIELTLKIVQEERHFKLKDDITSLFTTIKQALLKQVEVINSGFNFTWLNQQITRLEDDYQHYTMVEKDKALASITKRDLDQLLKIKQALTTKSDKELAFDVIKPLCEAVETPVRKDRYLKINGVIVYTIKTQEEFELLKKVLE